MIRKAIVVAFFCALTGCSGETLGPNRPPVANAGPDQVVDLNNPVWLDGSQSYDPEGKQLGYSWDLVAVPPGGQATLIVDDDQIAQLVPDVTGVWMIRLTVDDGSLSSQPDVVSARISGQPCEQDQECDDGFWCNGDEYCSNNFCMSSSRDCSFVADPCNDAGCDEDADQCVPDPVADGAGCDDGLYCTQNEECTGGVCGGQVRDCSEASAECVAGVCEEASRSCVGQPIADGDLCDDGQYCSVNERCSGGQCGGGQPRDCTAAGGGCLDGVCDENADQCTGDPLIAGIPCNDGQFCTINDDCDGLGNCLGDSRDCSGLSNQCNQGSCDDGVDQCMAIPANEGINCDDGLFCTTAETCQSGNCTGGQDLSCDDSDLCTIDACDEANDACDNQLVPNPNTEGVWVGGTCSDTVDNDCDRLVDDADPDCQECQNDGDCDDSNPCTNNTCQNNNCSTTLVGNGTACNDGRYCTNPDTCTDGICSGPGRDCSSMADQCNQDVCNEAASRCESQPIREGQACDDEVYCNVDEICQSGSCSGGQSRDCSVVADDCNTGYCDEGAGQCRQQAANEGSGCTDGLFCTDPDTCTGGTCSGPQRDCSGFGDQCNDGVCDEGGDVCAQQSKGAGAPCDDGIYCNGPDECNGSGSCDSHVGDPCTSGTPCNRTCNEGSENCFAPSGISCGSPGATDCTAADSCDGSGVCLSNDMGTGAACDDGIYCNGVDQCDGSGNCDQHTGDPCPGQVCDEANTQCADCLANGDCPSCQWCQGGACENQPDGTDVKGDCAPGPCGTGLCDGSGSCGFSVVGTSCGSSLDNLCDHPDQCDGAGTCDSNYEPSSTPCPDGLYCNGDETCDGSGVCQTGADPCPGTSCNETSDLCADCVTNEQCGLCHWCQGGVCETQPDDADVKDDCPPGECRTGLCNGGGGCGMDPGGTSCDGGDGNWCNSTCNGSGSCTGGPVNCPDDGNMCNGSESCNSSNGSCQSGPNLPASTYCDGNDLITCDGNGNMTGSQTCSNGCDSAADPDECVSQMVDPSNLDPALLCANGADLNIFGVTTINTDDGSITPDPGVTIVSSVVSQGGGAPDIRVFSFNNIDIQANVTVVGRNALALLACYDITVAGTIRARSTDRISGPGGWDGGPSESDGSGFDNGYGRGGPGQNGNPYEQTGGGGGAFGGAGGQGGDDDGNPAGGAGGQPYPGPTLEPLLGGSGGGGGGCRDDNDGGPGGGGGGAMQITAGGTLTVVDGAGVHVGGGGGNRTAVDGCAGGGGGAGGGILLEAVNVDMDGTLAANGGGGGGGDRYGSGINSADGEDGRFDGTRASGGNGGDGGARGGDGGAAGTANGDAGGDDEKAGGGGGAVGRIRINTQSGSASIGGTTSPNAGSGMFTQGTVSIW